jgi:hypothetical protein
MGTNSNMAAGRATFNNVCAASMQHLCTPEPDHLCVGVWRNVGVWVCAYSAEMPLPVCFKPDCNSLYIAKNNAECAYVAQVRVYTWHTRINANTSHEPIPWPSRRGAAGLRAHANMHQECIRIKPMSRP